MSEQTPESRVDGGRFIHHYRGYDIIFGDNSETWECRQLNVSHAKLSKAKEQIGKILAAARKLDEATPAIFLGDTFDRVASCHVMSVADDLAVPRRYDNEATKAAGPIQQVWITREPRYRRTGQSEIAREKTKITNLAADTPENWATIAEAKKMEVEARRLNEQSRKLLDLIPRLPPFETKPVEAKAEKPEQIEDRLPKRKTGSRA